MLVLSIFASVCHVLSLCARIYATLEFDHRNGQHLEHEQDTMISSYVYGAISHGDQGLQALHRDTSSSIPTLALVLHNLHHRTDTILRLCLPSYASHGQEEFHSFLVPCGMLFGIAVGPTLREWELGTVNTSSLNITIRYVASIWDTVSCDYHPNLRIADRGQLYSTITALNVTICGNSPQQTYFSASSSVRVSWLSRIFDVNKESFLLSYETVVPGYAKYYNTKIKLRTVSSEDRTAGEIFSPFLSKGNEYTYTWYIAGLVLTAPTLHVNEFRCTETSHTDETITLTVYDAPLSLLDRTFLEMDPSRVIQTLVCSDNILNESHKSSIGDLTLILTGRNGYKRELNASLAYAPIPCNDIVCSAVTHRLFGESQKGFRLLSQGTSQQRAIFRPRPQQGSSFLTFDDLEVHFEGFTHLPCTMGGLFLYYLQPLGRIGQICSDWTAEIWSGALKQEDGTTRLHLGDRPVMFVIKTYKGFTEGTIAGRVLLGNCLGVINNGFRGKLLLSPYYNSTSSDRRCEPYGYTTLIHQAGCVIFQYFQTDLPNCVHVFEYSQKILIRHRPNNNLQPEIQLGITGNMSAYPANLIVKDRSLRRAVSVLRRKKYK